MFPIRSYYGRITYTEKINFQVEVTEAMSKALRISGQSDIPFSPGRPGSNTYLVVSTRYCVLLVRDIRNVEITMMVITTMRKMIIYTNSVTVKAVLSELTDRNLIILMNEVGYL